MKILGLFLALFITNQALAVTPNGDYYCHLEVIEDEADQDLEDAGEFEELQFGISITNESVMVYDSNISWTEYIISSQWTVITNKNGSLRNKVYLSDVYRVIKDLNSIEVIETKADMTFRQSFKFISKPDGNLDTKISITQAYESDIDSEEYKIITNLAGSCMKTKF